jgi:glutaredoxin
MAKRLFDEQNIEYNEIDIEAEKMSREEMSKIGKGSTVPQILIDEKPIGGYDDLLVLYQSGNLGSNQAGE